MQRSDFLIRKIISALATLVVVVIFNFFLFRILPGDPVRGLIHSPRMTREAQERIRAQFDLDKPIWFNFEGSTAEALIDGLALLEEPEAGSVEVAAAALGEELEYIGRSADEQWVRLGQFNEAGYIAERGWVPAEQVAIHTSPFDSQFFAYLRNLLQGNLGISFATRQPVGELLAERVWRTVILVVVGEVLAIIIGIVLGILAAWRRGTSLDTGLLLWSLFTWAIPTFFFGIILVIVSRGHLPTGRMVTAGLRPEDGWRYWSDIGRHLILPTITMAVGYFSIYMMVMRSSIVEVLSEDYILTAKAKGLSTYQILRDHALKNAMLPMVTTVMLTLGYIVAGAIQVETVFSWPGIGRLMYEAVGKQDFPVLQGIFLLVAVSVITANFLTDLLYSVLDPRVRVQ